MALLDNANRLLPSLKGFAIWYIDLSKSWNNGEAINK
jgi:hypothetical protein